MRGGRRAPKQIADGVLDLSDRLLDLNRVEDVVNDLFARSGLPRLGGASGVRGWSSVSAIQRCAYLWKRTYIDGQKMATVDLDVGTLLHTYLALHYQRQIDPRYALTPEDVHEALMASGCATSVIVRIWQYWQRYKLEYAHDYLQPLAVEVLAVDPDDWLSCRYDLIARVSDSAAAYVTPGVYVVEHKTAGMFNDQTLRGWRGNGEIQGQILLWDIAGMRDRFGPLAGVIVNVIGKQKLQKFHRATVVPTHEDRAQHARDVVYFKNYLTALRSTGTWPRSRANCYSNGGRCSQWDHCLGDDFGSLAARLTSATSSGSEEEE